MKQQSVIRCVQQHVTFLRFHSLVSCSCMFTRRQCLSAHANVVKCQSARRIPLKARSIVALLLICIAMGMFSNDLYAFWSTNTVLPRKLSLRQDGSLLIYEGAHRKCSFIGLKEFQSSSLLALLTEKCQFDAPQNWAEKVLSFTVLYNNDAELLRKQIQSWNILPDMIKRSTGFVIIDDGSFELPALVILAELSDCSVDILVFKIHNDIPWNIGGARNLAMLVAPTPYVFLGDADVIADSRLIDGLSDLVRRAKDSLQSTKRYLIFSQFQRITDDTKIPLGPHPAVMLLSKETYWMVGGCDEDFCGSYGYTDPHFWYRVGQIENVARVSVSRDFPQIAPLIQVMKRDPGVQRSKNRTVNKLLFEAKTLKQNWSSDYLRFSWSPQSGPCQ